MGRVRAGTGLIDKALALVRGWYAQSTTPTDSFTGVPAAKAFCSSSLSWEVQLDGCHHSFVGHPDKGFKHIWRRRVAQLDRSCLS